MECWISIVLTGILAGLLAILYYSKENYFKKHGIPHEMPLPIFGNMIKITLQITSFAKKIEETYYMNTEAKYIGFYICDNPVIMIRDPELVKDITTKFFNHFENHRTFVDPIRDRLFGNIIFSIRGDYWRQNRKTLASAFTPHKMKKIFKLMTECSENFANYLTEVAEKSKILTINSKNAFSRYAIDIIASYAFGIVIDSMRDPNNEFYILGKKATNFEGLLSLKFLLLHSFPKLSNLLHIKLIDKSIEPYFNRIISETIAMRSETGVKRPDMIQLMMELRNNKNYQGPELTIQEITGQSFNFIFGGLDTASSLMCFLAHEISINNEIQTKLHSEIDEVNEKYNGEPSYETIDNMQYLDAVVNETMRLYPIFIVMDRECTKSFELPPTLPGTKSFKLKPGDSIMIPVHAFHTDSQYYYEPKKFLPERFIDNPRKILNSSTYMPFGNGPRMCTGYKFAIMETKVFLFYLMSKCILKPSKKMILPLKMSASSFTLLPKGGFWLDLQSRNL